MDILSEYSFFFMALYVAINALFTVIFFLALVYNHYIYYFILTVVFALFLQRIMFSGNVYRSYLLFCYAVIFTLSYSIVFMPLFYVGALFTYDFNWSYYAIEMGNKIQMQYTEFARYEYLDNYCIFLFMLSLPLILHYNGAARRWCWLSRRYRRYYMHGALQASKRGIILHFNIMKVIAVTVLILYVLFKIASLAEKLSGILPPFSWNPFLM